MSKLYVVATPIGNLDDISHRAIKTLSQVSWIAAEDTRLSKALLVALNISTPLISYHEHNEKTRSDELIARLQAGESGALISDAGTPLISDPGYLLVAKAHEAHIPVVPIPGPCAAIAALCASGLPTRQFLFEGFLPPKTQARCKRLTELAQSPYTLVFYEAPHRILDFLKDCVAVLGSQRRLAVSREITKKFESIIVNTCETLLKLVEAGEIPLKGEFVVVVEPFQEIVKQGEDGERVLRLLLEEVSLKQAVMIATKLTGLPKNALYDLATRLQKDK